MKPIETPAFRLTARCIWNSFLSSGKRHLLLAGSRAEANATLLAELRSEQFLCGVSCAASRDPWASPEEIGDLSVRYTDSRAELVSLMAKKRLLAEILKDACPLWTELCHRDDVFFVDLDDPFGSLGCVIMASGLGKRFGGNKLMADFEGSPMLQWVLDATNGIFTQRVVVTRHEAVHTLCKSQKIPVMLHALPDRSDTTRLGIQYMGPDISGCMFVPGDQPLLSCETIASLALCAVNEPDSIWRAADGQTAGAPVLFPHWAFEALRTLPVGKGGSAVIGQYPHRVRTVPVGDPWELRDIDSPQDLEALLTHC